MSALSGSNTDIPKILGGALVIILVVPIILFTFQPEQTLKSIIDYIISPIITIGIIAIIGLMFYQVGFKKASDGSIRYNGRFITKKMQFLHSLVISVFGIVLVVGAFSLNLPKIILDFLYINLVNDEFINTINEIASSLFLILVVIIIIAIFLGVFAFNNSGSGKHRF